MYNPEQKKRYLDFCEREAIYNTTTIELNERVFSATEMSEKQFDKDVSKFTQPEVVDLLKGLNFASPRTLQMYCSFLSNYHSWCYNIEKIIDSIIDPFDKRIAKGIIESIITKDDLEDKHFSKTKMLEMIDCVMDVSNRFIAYALYCGLSIKELINLKINDLDFENNKLTLISGRIIVVDELFRQLMIQTDAQEQYFFDGVIKESRSNAFDYVKSEYVLKSCNSSGNSDIIKRSVFSARIKVIKTQMDNNFVSVSVLNRNGLINHIKERYEENGMTLKKALLEKVKNVYKYDKQTEEYVKEFGMNTEVRMIRFEAKDYIDKF